MERIIKALLYIPCNYDRTVAFLSLFWEGGGPFPLLCFLFVKLCAERLSCEVCYKNHNLLKLFHLHTVRSIPHRFCWIHDSVKTYTSLEQIVQMISNHNLFGVPAAVARELSLLWYNKYTFICIHTSILSQVDSLRFFSGGDVDEKAVFCVLQFDLLHVSCNAVLHVMVL